MDTRKLILHIDGDSGVQSRIELEDFGTTHYIDGDTDMVAELVKRWNAYPQLIAMVQEMQGCEGYGEKDVLDMQNEAHTLLVSLGEAGAELAQ